MAASMEVLEWIQEFMDEHTNLCKWRALGLYARLYIFLWVGKLSLWKLLEVVCMRPQTSIQMSTCERLYKQTVLLQLNETFMHCAWYSHYFVQMYFFFLFFLTVQDNRSFSCAPPACQFEKTTGWFLTHLHDPDLDCS